MGVPFTAGGLTAAQARQLNELMRTMEQFARLTVAAPLNLSRASGIPIISAPTLAGFKSSWKEPVRVATTAAGTLASSFENGDTVDGVVLKTGDRILIKDQAAQTANGIYVVNPSGAPTRAADCDSGEELLCAVVMVSEGTVNKDTVWGQTADAPIVAGTTNIVWILLAPGSSNLTWNASATAADHDGDAGSSGDIPAYSITANDTWENTGIYCDAPATGTYLCMMTATAQATISAGGPGTVRARMYNETTSTPLTPLTGGINGYAYIGGATTAGQLFLCGSLITVESLASGDRVRMEAWRTSGSTWTLSTIIGYSGSQVSRIHLVKLA